MLKPIKTTKRQKVTPRTSSLSSVISLSPKVWIGAVLMTTPSLGRKHLQKLHWREKLDEAFS